MAIGIKLVALGATPLVPELWVGAYDPDAHDGGGDVLGTVNPAKALRFETIRAAWECWNQVSTVRPIRPDGRPNKPMTAYSITIEELPGEA